MKFVTIGLTITIFILAILSIAMYDSGNPDSALAGLFLFLVGLPISMAAAGVVLWIRLRRDKTVTTFKRVIVFVMLLPLAMLVFIGIRFGLDSMRNERIRRYTVHAHVMTLHVDSYTSEQRYFFRSDGRLGFNYGLLKITRLTLENEQSQQQFEHLFNVALPEVDFKNYFFRVLPGQEYDRWNYTLQTHNIDPHAINVYKVNRVR